ncbi:MAG TPA: class I SAM-dependent methyltransferase [Cyclobacteriaceae bacterium]|nr:class I SAM-dependent methyltransferase [Cyclobacteriaceae bacterium]HQQ98781.1 class I SAM-dependent methyltransferase [Cyclobacteriaceae bacterium]
MTDPWLERWNERYSKEDFAFGEEPNDYLRAQLPGIAPGAILFPAEGEGRNAVYAASLGWKTFAFDISPVGRKKAMILADKHHVNIDYQVGALDTLTFSPNQFDAIALIYAHFPAEVKSAIHKSLVRLLRPGGTVIFEAFSKKHLEYNSKDEKIGGPKDLASLFSIEEIEHDFSGFNFSELIETEIELHEGKYHNGKGSVIRFVGKKR